MRVLRKSASVAAVLLLGSASLTSSATAEWKCGGRTMPGYRPEEAVFILDGGVVGKEKTNEIESADIDHIEVTCWNPHNRKFRVAPGVPVILAWTKHFREASSERLEEVIQARKAHASGELRLLYEAGGA